MGSQAAIGWAIAEADKALVDGADEFLQILRIFSVIMTQVRSFPVFHVLDSCARSSKYR